jgi:xanthine dehydrogenase YagR molybdenum-binding subunit
MRGPGEATGTYALECAMDELAYKLNMDPIEFRLLNYTETDPEFNRPHSSKFLKECYQLGAEKIGWKNRRLQPRSLKEGEWLAGYGMGTGVFIAWRGGAKVAAKFTADGRLTLQSAVTDMGPGTATAMTKLASDVFGLTPDKIKFELGDSNYPPGGVQGGSGTTSTLGTTVNNACVSLKKKLTELVKDNPVFHTEKIHRAEVNDIVFGNDFMSLASDPTKKVSYADALRTAGVKQIEITEESKGYADNKYTTYSYSVHFVKVLVNENTGVVKVDRVVTAIDAGKIVSRKTAESQIIGGVVGGIGMALMEEGIIDHRYGRWVNNNFADYHVPVHTDVPHIDVLFVNKPDPVLNPMGSKGMGEIALIGFPPAVANAIFNATGKRVRDLPITPDKLI